MTEIQVSATPTGHHHVFLGEGHERAERRTWVVIWLCGAMMALEIGGGALFGSIALIADGLHMSTHAGALLLAALAYSYARKHTGDPRFSFGTGKFGDLAGFSSAIILAMISLLIGYEAVLRFFAPVPIHFREAIPIATLGLGVNVVSAWLLAGGAHHHGHGHHHHGRSDAHDHDEERRIATPDGLLVVSIFEADHPPVFRVAAEEGPLPDAAVVMVETVRPDGARQLFPMESRDGFLQSADEIPEPHAFAVHLRAAGGDYQVAFEEHVHDAHGAAHRDNNMRSAIVHVIADGAVSVLVIVGLLLARAFGWLWMDPLAGAIGAVVIASWSYGLIKDTGAILLDMCPDPKVEQKIRLAMETDGDRVHDLHLWRLGPGHLGAIVSVLADKPQELDVYKRRLAGIRSLSHITIEIDRSVSA